MSRCSRPAAHLYQEQLSVRRDYKISERRRLVPSWLRADPVQQHQHQQPSRGCWQGKPCLARHTAGAPACWSRTPGRARRVAVLPSCERLTRPAWRDAATSSR
jgi:hypothetical protein